MVKKILRSKFNLTLVIGCILAFIFTIFSYLMHNSTINRGSFLFDGIVAQLFLYRIIKFSADRIKIKLNRIDYLILLCVLFSAFAIYLIIINIRTTIYTWDNTTYYNLMNLLLPNFDQSVFSGLSEWLMSGMSFDYGDFMLIFIYPFYFLLGAGIKTFIYSYFLGCVVPVVILLYILGNYLALKWNFERSLVIFKIVLGFVLVGFPLLHTASISGQPDIFGLSFASIIVLLTIDYDFSKIDIFRWIVLFVTTVSLALTRRWYIYFILAYYIAYFIVLFTQQLINKDYKTLIKSFRNTIIFGISSAIIGVIVLSKMILTVLGNNYSESYVAWNKGGFWYEFLNQFEFLGLLVSILVIIGWIYGIFNKNFRKITITFLLTYVISIFAFTRIQNMGHHQSLILFIPYFYGLIMAISLCYKLRVKYSIVVPTMIIAISFVNCSCFNFSNNIGDMLFSKLDVYPTQREDLEGINEVVKYLQKIVKDDDTVTILAASNEYDTSVFANYPDIKSNEFIVSNNYYAASGGFPENFFTSKYVVLIDPIQEREQVKSDAVLSKIIDEFNSNDIIKNKFNKMSTINITKDVTATVYERIEAVDEAEVDVFIQAFSDYCDRYKEIFYDRLMSYN
jgi:hypothetical protein